MRIKFGRRIFEEIIMGINVGRRILKELFMEIKFGLQRDNCNI